MAKEVAMTPPSVDRVAGALVGLAAGDALGAGNEIATPPAGEAEMIGGGLGDFAPGEWTDDTQMAICIAEVTATGAVDAEAIGQGFLDWYRSGPADVGVQTSKILSSAHGPRDLPHIAAHHFRHHPRSAAGNGSLMRTAPVARAPQGAQAPIPESAQAVSAQTQRGPQRPGRGRGGGRP
jgi:ADP-ribosyl-[dinitrogen reductase] hydrolase